MARKKSRIGALGLTCMAAVLTTTITTTGAQATVYHRASHRMMQECPAGMIDCGGVCFGCVYGPGGGCSC
jgi:hypothetical protein